MNKPTEKQLNYIKAIEDSQLFGKFTGETKEDASKWLNQVVPKFKEYEEELTRMNELDCYTNWENESING